MRLLILGGTVFLGRHCVDVALARGHTVTLFNRGQHSPDLYPDLEKLRGDRGSDLSSLKGKRWDAVIDTSGFYPRAVRMAAGFLANQVRWYAFISTISVYSDLSRPGITEDAATGTLKDETVEEVNGDTYGPLKALCEKAAEKAMPGRVLIIRPGLIVGPHDPTDRFTYWPHRVARGGDVLAPAPPDQPAQVIDARDLAEFTIRNLEIGRMGVYHCTGPSHRLTLGRVLGSCKAVSGGDARFVWVPQEFLLEQKVGPWMELPLWIPSGTPLANLQTVNISKALGAGLTFRPLVDTIRDTLVWDATRPADLAWRAGMKPEREAELLEMWRKRG